MLFLFCVFTGILFSVGPPGAQSFCFSFLPAAFGNWRPPVAPSFVARRKIGEKGVPRGCGPLNPRGNVLEDSDVLCAYHLATVRLTRLSRAWRAPHCFHALCVLRCSEKQQDLRNHPTSDYKLSWLFFQCQHFRRSACGTIESVEAVQKGGPAKAQRSGFGGERRSNGMTELLPRKAKRRIWSLRRRDGPKSR